MYAVCWTRARRWIAYMPYRSAITQPLQREEHTLQVTEILFSCSESSVLAPLFFFFPMKVEYLLWCHNSSTWRFKKKKYIGHYSSTSKWSLIFQPQCSLCIMIPHFLHLCSWSLPNSGFVFLIFGSLWPDLSSDHLLFYINQKISACEYVLSRD